MRLKKVNIFGNSLDVSEFETYEVENISEFLMSHFETWPETARIYHNVVSINNDVTPYDDASIDFLNSLDGEFHVVLIPAFALPVWAIAAIVVVTVVAAAILLRPKIPNVSVRNTQSTSPNNELSSRSNQARVNGRIPDIYGQVRSTPDLIAAAYSEFEDGKDVENALMCIGRGEYTIYDAKDGETSINQIVGSSIEVYKPGISINTGTPYFSVGDPISTDFLYTSKSNSVNGQTLLPVGANAFSGNGVLIFEYPNLIKIPDSDPRSFPDFFGANKPLTISGAVRYTTQNNYSDSMVPLTSTQLQINRSSVPSGLTAGSKLTLIGATFTEVDEEAFPPEVLNRYQLDGTYDVVSATLVSGHVTVVLNNPGATNPYWTAIDSATGTIRAKTTTYIVSSGSLIYNLDGTYAITSVDPRQIALTNPASINSDWNSLNGNPFNNSYAALNQEDTDSIGPFILESSTRTGILANFVALNGIYTDDGQTQTAASVGIRLSVTQVDNTDFPIGPTYYYNLVLLGSSVNTDQVGGTLKIVTPFVGRCSVEALRVTPKNTQFQGNVVDEVKWRDLYGFEEMADAAFNGVTVVRSKVYSTVAALSLKERKLNLLVTRNINEYLGGTNFSSDLRPITRAADILMNVSLDQKIGNRNISELDLANIYDQCYTQPLSYFGTSDATQFCYTFDSNSLSYEETAQMIANAVFNTAYRTGNIIKCSFEKETEDSTILYNHRNKIPGTEKRTQTFGNSNDYDGVELEYVSPIDDAIVTIYLPTDRSAINPNKIETVGIRNLRQAHFKAWREFQKQKYQTLNIEFDATQEAELSIPTDRILVSDNTRSGTQDGEITSQSGLTIFTSQKLIFEAGKTYTMYLQLSDGTVEGIAVTAGSAANSAILAQAPRLALSVDPGAYAKTAYILVGSNDTKQRAFLVTEKLTQDAYTSKIRAGNYDARFYSHDKDFINGLI